MICCLVGVGRLKISKLCITDGVVYYRNLSLTLRRKRARDKRDNSVVGKWYAVRNIIMWFKKIAVILLFAFPVYAADTVVYNEGIIVYSMGNASKLNPYYELSYDHRAGNNGVELTAGYYDIKINGEEYLYTDSLSHGIYGNNQVRAKLHSIPLSIAYKRYKNKWYAGYGVGYQFLWLDRYYDAPEGIYNGEYYSGRESVHNTVFEQFKIGYNVSDRISVEVKFNHADVDMESGTYFIGLAEDKSNLNLVIISAAWKW